VSFCKWQILNVHFAYADMLMHVYIKFVDDIVFSGNSRSSVSASIGGVPCLSTVWVSENVLKCIVPPRRGCDDPGFEADKQDGFFAVTVSVNGHWSQVR
jgi:hypothetical protein